jgi:hypothetical protein
MERQQPSSNHLGVRDVRQWKSLTEERPRHELLIDRSAAGTYELKAFNHAVVLDGNVPLDVLAKDVDEYLRR